LPALALFFKSCRHLVLNPIALDRMLGQDQQHLVPQPDSFVDPVKYFRADRQIMFSEPAAHPLLLKVGLQARGKLLILHRVTDEA
jgi:hypothetical protein